MYRDPNKFKSLADDVPGITLSPTQQLARTEMAEQERRAAGRQRAAARIRQDREAIAGAVQDVRRSDGGMTMNLLSKALPYVAAHAVAGPQFDDSLPREATREAYRQQQRERFLQTPEGQAQQRQGRELRAQIGASLASAIPAPPKSGERPRIEIPSALAKPEQRRADQRAALDATGGPVALEDQVLAQNTPDTLPRRADGQEWGNLADGIVGRRNADGVMEFSNQPGDQAAASGRVMRDGQIGNGMGGLSVVSGGAEAMRRNQRATEIMQQARLERTNPNYVTVVRPTGNGLQGVMNERLNRRDERDRAERSAAHQSRIDAGRQRLAQFGQEDDQRALQARQQGIEDERLGMDRARFGWEEANQEFVVAERQRMDRLREIMADPSASAEDRAMAQAEYQVATIPAKDRFMRMDSVLGQDTLGQPIMGSQIIDVATGQPVMAQGLGQQGGAQVVTSEEVREMARQHNISESAARKLAEQRGYEVRD